MKLPPVSMIVAMTEKGRVIGYKGGKPWHLPRDLKRFRKVTRNSTVVMGPKTFASIGKPLPGRLNIVLTTREDLNVPPGVLIAANPVQALKIAKEHPDAKKYPEFFVIGGGKVFESFLPLAEQLFITMVQSDIIGDTHFPSLKETHWYETWREDTWRQEPEDSCPSRFIHLRRTVTFQEDQQVNWKLPETQPSE